MPAEIIRFNGVTTVDGLADDSLHSALAAKLETAIIIGVDEDGDFYFASNKSDGAEVLWWIEIAKKKLLDIGSE